MELKGKALPSPHSTPLVGQSVQMSDDPQGRKVNVGTDFYIQNNESLFKGECYILSTDFGYLI